MHRILRQDAACAEEKLLNIRVENPTAHLVITADERRIKQIIFNLLGNAIKFTPDGGHIKLFAVQVDHYVNISVSDTGIGIAPEDHERIFEAFDQGSSQVSKKYGGSGLGLPLVKKLAELHGGSVSVESRLGEGATFTVSLMVNPPQATNAGQE